MEEFKEGVKNGTITKPDPPKELLPWQTREEEDKKFEIKEEEED